MPVRNLNLGLHIALSIWVYEQAEDADTVRLSRRCKNSDSGVFPVMSD